MTFGNFIDLFLVIDNYSLVALNNTIEYYLHELEDTFIPNDLYSIESTWGGRSGQFGVAWSSKMSANSNEVYGELYYDSSKLSITANINGDHYSGDISALPEILNSGVGYNFGNFEGLERPYWDNFLNFVYTTFEEKYAEEFNKLVT